MYFVNVGVDNSRKKRFTSFTKKKLISEFQNLTCTNMITKIQLQPYLHQTKFLYKAKQLGIKLLQLQHRSLFRESKQLFRCSTYSPLLKVPIMHNSCRNNSCWIPVAHGAIVPPIIVTKTRFYTTVFCKVKNELANFI